MAATVMLVPPCCASRPIPAAWQPVQMQRSNADGNSNRWHTITVNPPASLPRVHFYDRLNPTWWWGNIDDPVPPPDYRPLSRHRILLWHLRNPFHNFDHYVIGVADRKFKRSGRFPERNSNPNGGWDFEVARYKMAVLPFLSCQHGAFNFYLGWRERGDFGIKVNRSSQDSGPKVTVR